MKENEVRFGLWAQTSKNGAPYWSGTLKDKNLTDVSAFLGAAESHNDKVRIAIFKNSRKEKDSQPDYNAVLSIVGERKQEQTTQRVDRDDDESLPF